MIARLGQVLYWMFSGIALLIVASVAYYLAADGSNKEEALLFVLWAAAIWLFGRAGLYVLAGR